MTMLQPGKCGLTGFTLPNPSGLAHAFARYFAGSCIRLHAPIVFIRTSRGGALIP